MRGWIITLSAALLLLSPGAFAQKFSVSTNLVDYTDFATLNIQGSWSFSRHWTLNADIKYNPFSYNTRSGSKLNAKQRLVSLGSRYWPWHVYSGWWFSGKVQIQEYNRGGIKSARTEEGDRYGAGISAGYSYMLRPNLNLDIGAGVWGGYNVYKVYSCPVCGLTEKNGRGYFILPTDLMISLAYVF